jgi:hypothetical protein
VQADAHGPECAPEPRLEQLKQRNLRLEKAKEAEGNSPLDWSGWAVALNYVHPSFRGIREALHSTNIPLKEIFGDPEDVPHKWIIALSHHLPTSHTLRLLRAVISFGFDGFQFWEPQREAGEDEDVYIGGYRGGDYALVTPELHALLSKKPEAADLIDYYKRHTVKQAD